MKLGRIGQFFHPLIKASRIDPAIALTKSRKMPKIAPQTLGNGGKKENERTRKHPCKNP